MTVIDRHTLIAKLGSENLAIKTAKLILDDAWSPYGQAEITCPLPANLDTIDPRLSLRLNLRAEQSFGMGPTIGEYTLEVGASVSVWTAAYGGSIPTINANHFSPFNSFGLRDSNAISASLSLRSRTIDWVESTVSLSFATDEALLQAYALVSAGPFDLSTTSCRAAVQYVLSLIGAFLEPGIDDGVIGADASQWLPGITAWDYLSPLVQTAGLRLYCDQLRRWYLVTDNNPAEGQLVLSDLVNLTTDRDTIDLDGDWYDAVVITYKWNDEAGSSQRAWDSAAEPNFTKVLALTYETPYPGPGGAANVLVRALGRGRIQEVRAISNYTVIPGQAVSVTMTGDETQVGFISSVGWEWPAAEMDVSSRGLIEAPPTAWILDTPGVSWADLPVGIDWTEDI